MDSKTRKMIYAALFTALSFIATYAIKIPTPTMGYIHPGDSIVLLSGIFLGPIYGGLAAGIGSFFCDMAGGYAIYAPGTLIIKALTAAAASGLFGLLKKQKAGRRVAVLISGIAAELIVIFGYFFYEIFVFGVMGNGFTVANILSGVTIAASSLLFTVVQSTVGIVLAVILYPVLEKVFNR